MDFKTLYNHTKDLHLLYVEDDTDIVKQSVELFELLFSSVTVCLDGQEALQTYKKIENRNKFDIVLTDINMPNLNGLQLIKEIIDINPKQHISVISAHDDSSILINLGIDSFLLKPMQEKQLMQTLYKISYNIQNEKISHKYQEKIVKSNLDLEFELKKRLIFISADQNGNFAEISIRDNAGGIDKDIIDKIFEPYFTTKHQTQGTGIGLYMSKEIIQKHMQGEIEAKNISYQYKDQHYNGAEFTIKIPQMGKL